MKKIKKIIASCLLVSSLAGITGCSTQQKANTVLGEVNGVQITLADVDSELKPYIDYLKELNGEDFEKKLDEQTRLYFNSERASVLNQLIQEEILLTKAKELNMIPSDEELNSQIDERIKEMEDYYGGAENFNEAKEQYGYTDESFKEFIKNQLIQEIIVDDITKDVTVSDDEIKTHYADHKDTDFTQNPGATTKHILFEKEEEAKKCIEEINAKTKTFDEIFELYSENASTGTFPLSENLGFVEYEQENFDKDFLAGLKKLKVDEISEPVKSSFGYHVIKVTDINNSKTTLDFEEVKDGIKEQILYDKKYEIYQNKLSEWKDEMNVKITAESIGYKPEEE